MDMSLLDLNMVCFIYKSFTCTIWILIKSHLMKPVNRVTSTCMILCNTTNRNILGPGYMTDERDNIIRLKFNI